MWKTKEGISRIDHCFNHSKGVNYTQGHGEGKVARENSPMQLFLYQYYKNISREYQYVQPKLYYHISVPQHLLHQDSNSCFQSQCLSTFHTEANYPYRNLSSMLPPPPSLENNYMADLSWYWKKPQAKNELIKHLAGYISKWN